VIKFKLLFIATALLAFDHCHAELQRVHEIHFQMGTFLAFTVWHDDDKLARRVIRDAVEEVHRLDRILSNYAADSDLSRLNQAAGRGPQTVPNELYDLLRLSRRMSEVTDGLFDVTVGGLMTFWRDHATSQQIPSKTDLVKVVADTGYQQVVLLEHNRIEILRAATQIDFGGIGKGFAIDRAAARLKQSGIKSALINFGGSSIIAIGTPPNGTGWEVGVKDPDADVHTKLMLHDQALATSSSMGRVWQLGRKTYGHLVNPQTGMPMTINRTATVIARNAAIAEALTKPLVLIGSQALSYIDGFPGTVAMIMTERKKTVRSKEFSTPVTWKELPHS